MSSKIGALTYGTLILLGLRAALTTHWSPVLFYLIYCIDISISYVHTYMVSI